ncbi:hypothetical protein HYT02_05620 [Candidatus Gottesmanbacteria bacterium]|nr:hypothetical protein [Candidatus Gottesmanbacteria bacterium]
MKRVIWISILFFGLTNLLLSPKIIHAGGGRIVIQNFDTGAFVGTPVNLSFKVYHAGSNNEAISTNEKMEFRIENPRSGDRCWGKTERTNEQGLIEGFCSAQEPGNYLAYLYSIDKNDESSRVYVYFNAQPTPTPTNTPIPLPTSTPMSTVTPTESITYTSPTSPLSPTQQPTSVHGSSDNKQIAFILTAFLLVILFIYFIVARKLFNKV